MHIRVGYMPVENENVNRLELLRGCVPDVLFFIGLTMNFERNGRLYHRL